MDSVSYIAALDDAEPEIHPEAFVAHGAVIAGRVRLGSRNSTSTGTA